MTTVYHTDLADGHILTLDLPINRQTNAQEIIDEWSRHSGYDRTIAANVMTIGDLLVILSLGWDNSDGKRRFTARELTVANFGINESMMNKLMHHLNTMQKKMYKSMHIAEHDIDWEVAWYDLVDRWMAVVEEYTGTNTIILSSKSFEQTLAEAMILDENEENQNPTESESLPEARDIFPDIDDIARRITEDPDIFNDDTDETTNPPDEDEIT